MDISKGAARTVRRRRMAIPAVLLWLLLAGTSQAQMLVREVGAFEHPFSVQSERTAALRIGETFEQIGDRLLHGRIDPDRHGEIHTIEVVGAGNAQ